MAMVDVDSSSHLSADSQPMLVVFLLEITCFVNSDRYFFVHALASHCNASNMVLNFET